MDQIASPRSLTRAAPMAAFAAGALAALVIAVLPQWRLEAAVSATGLGGVLAAARPPLGATARAAMALTSGGLVAAAVWGALAIATRRWLERAGSDAAGDVPVLRRADAHPDAPSRRPLRASADLTEPSGRPLAIARARSLPEDAVAGPIVVRAVPADLDTPLAAVDPNAIPATPREPVRPVAPLARPVATEADLAETFDLTPIRRASPPAVAAPAPTRATSLAAMLDRLEQGAARRGRRPTPSLEETLGILRGLAPR